MYTNILIYHETDEIVSNNDVIDTRKWKICKLIIRKNIMKYQEFLMLLKLYVDTMSQCQNCAYLYLLTCSSCCQHVYI